MDESNLKRYITIGLIVLVNIIAIIFTCISVIKSVNRVASSDQASVPHTEINTETNTEELTEMQDEEQIINEENGDDINEGLSMSSIFSKVAKIKDYIDMQNLLTCILLIIGANLAILASFIYRKIK